MIVGVIAERTHDDVRSAMLRLADELGPDRVLAEVRLDALDHPDGTLVKTCPVPVIATCRRRRDGGLWRGTESDRLGLLHAAFESGARWVDVELDALPLVPWARGERILGSIHDFDGTPAGLADTISQALEMGVARIKVAVRTGNLLDLCRVAKLPGVAAGRVVAFGLGPVGIPSRYLFRRLGSPWMYVRASDSGNLLGDAATGLPDLGTVVGQAFSDARASDPVAVFGVLSDRALDSVGPRVWNRVFRTLRIPALYLPFTTPDLVGLRETCRLLGVRGLSVTTPFKDAVLRLADDRHPLVDAIGAANTLHFHQGSVVAYNTDYRGVLEPVQRAMRAGSGTGLADRALVLGVGGAGRAAVWALKNLGLEVGVWSRRRAHAREVAARLDVEAVAGDPGFEVKVIVQATPAGGPRDPGGLPVTGAWFRPGQIFLEMNQREGGTPLMQVARDHGAAVIGGDEMYLAQALHQFHLFWSGLGSAGAEKAMEEALRWGRTQPVWS